MRIASWMLLVPALVGFGCKKKGEESATKPAAETPVAGEESAGAAEPSSAAGPALAERALEGMGMVIDAPADWTLQASPDGSGAMLMENAPMTAGAVVAPQIVSVMKMPMAAPSLDELVGQCTGVGGTVVEQAETDGSRLVVCRQSMAGQEVRQVNLYRPLGDDGAILCNTSGGPDHAMLLGICRSLRAR
jgi:hypothetical protein